jgi:long-chain acyl-CoA synthetase
LRLGASDERPALCIDGRSWTYREFAGVINDKRGELQLGAPDPRQAPGQHEAPGPLVATGQPLVKALAMVFAAAAAGVPVLVSDPSTPVPTVGSTPPGTFLIAVTSGTSGRPRPVLRTAASWTASFAPLARLAGITPDDRVLLTGPLHATMHLFAAVHTLALGAELTDRPMQATAVHAVPAVLSDLLTALPGSAPLRTAVVAGTALSPAIGDRALARGVEVTEYYGAAELSFVAARRYPAPLRPFPPAEVDIRDGALWVRSPYLATGYADGVTGPLLFDPNGFATVGDLADRTADGGMLIRGRGDAAITTGGATVLAEDIEAVLAGLPGVAAVAVVGVPHTRLGQVVTAVIEPHPAADLSTVRTAARAVLRDQSLPRRWLLADHLPRTPGGKIARHVVAQAAAATVGGEPLAGSLLLRPLA